MADRQLACLKKSAASKEGTPLVGTKVAGLAYALTTGCPPPVDIRRMAALAHPRAGAVSLLGTMLAAPAHLNVPSLSGSAPRKPEPISSTKRRSAEFTRAVLQTEILR